MSQQSLLASIAQPDKNDYGKAEYWDKRYSLLPQFDWLMNYAHFKSNGLTQLFKKTDRFIMLGSGSARFSADMFDDGFEYIDNIDISSVVIDKEKELNQHRINMKYSVMDVLDLDYENETFHVAIDKSTTDSLLCRPDKIDAIPKMLNEAWRVLKPGGLYITLTLRSEDTILPYFTADAEEQDNNWSSLQTLKIPNPSATAENGKVGYLAIIVATKAIDNKLDT